MANDELNAPLGQSIKKQRRRINLLLIASRAIVVALVMFLSVWTGWALLINDPLGGEPVVVVATNASPSQTADRASPMPDMPGADGARHHDGPGATPRAVTKDDSTTPAFIPVPGAKTVTIIDGSTGKRQEVPISATQDARAPVEQKLLESSRYGLLPRIGPDGARPADVYARPARTLPNKKDAPRVAIVVGGLSISASVTKQAIEKLPASVTLAFAPYGAQVDQDATKARAEGHEVLLQVPMEPFEYPDNDPGPQTLLTSLSGEQNLDRLQWLMGRFQGYVGIAGTMGARFTSTEQALAPVLKETARRGLIYVDDGASTRSLAGQIASANNMPFAKAELTIDAVPTAAQIDRALARLEAMAREHGSAVGYASAVPASIERIAQWAKAAESRGILLVPITAVAIKPKSS